MTPEQYKAADLLQKQIIHQTNIRDILHDAANSESDSIEISFSLRHYNIPKQLVTEFLHSAQRSLNKLEEEFNEL